MPIRASEKARYPANWPEISRRIRERDGQRCQMHMCGAPNGVEIKRNVRDPFKWVTSAEFTRMLLDADRMGKAEALARDWHRPIVVVLTVSHRDHKPENCSDENLVSLCQRCHLRYDQPIHVAHARETRARKRGQGSLFR